MRSINRVAIVVRPKPAFFEWAGSLQGERVENPEIWFSVYLVEAPEDVDHPQETLPRHFQRVFEEQLESRHTREADWPSPRTFALFCDWFDVQVGDLIFDLSDDEPLEYDD